jgi:hypothetical protein
MMKRFLTCLFLLSLVTSFYAQDDDNQIIGTVTFITSTNVYVRFDSTDDINIDDTLQISGNDCLVVTNKSSTSIVCSIINDCKINNGDSVTYSLSKNDVIIDNEPVEEEVIPAEDDQIQPEIKEKESMYSERIRGRITAASYNNFSNLREDRHRLMTKFSLNADHIDDSKFSVESFLSYRNIITPSESNYSGRTSIFNVYNLNLQYDATPTLSVSAGRKINSKASTIGAVDGLQAEKYFDNVYVGVIGGYRPDFSDYGLNTDLLQYGGYVGVETDVNDFRSQTTLGAIEQTNSGSTDRRYIFLQHYSTIASNLSLFGSSQLDIYGNNGNSTRLTNLYLSARYRFNRSANIMLSYDSRKQIIYYETYQSEIERLLDEDLARQGIRVRLNIRPFKLLWAGISYSSRFQNDNENKSDNVYGYITFTKIPKIGGRLNISYNMNSSNYLKSNILSTRYSVELIKNKLNSDLYYRKANYDYNNRNVSYSHDYYGMGLSYRISRTWQFSLSGEYSQFEEDKNFRFFTMISKRFYNKKKK